MEAAQNIQARFGKDAAKAISGLIGSSPVGKSALNRHQRTVPEGPLSALW